MGLDLLLFAVAAVSCCTDLKCRKIYNVVIYPALVLALALRLSAFGLSGLIPAAQGLALGLVFLLIPYLLGGIGGGDVKLLGVIGAIKGPLFVCYCFLAAALIGGLMSLGLLCYRKRLSQAVGHVGAAVQATIRTGLSGFKSTLTAEGESLSLPYGVAIACGAVITYMVV